MATIDKLNYLNETKQMIKAELNKLGSEITDETTFRAYVDKIKNIYNEYPKVTGSGTEITLNNTKKGRIDLGLKGNTSQDSTTGKNLYKPFNFTKTTRGITFVTSEDGSISANGTATGSAQSIYSAEVELYFITLNSGNYTISGGSSNMTIEALKADATTIVETDETGKATFELLEQTQIFLRAHITKDTTVENEKIYPQLESGTTATDYEPYTEGQPSPSPSFPQQIKVVKENNTISVGSINYPINLGNLELCKIADYQDYLYKSNDKWYKKSYIGKVILNGSENISYVDSGNWNFRYTPTQAIIDTQSSDYTKVMSNYFTGKSTGEDLAITDYNNQICFRYDLYKTGSANDFKTWLSSYNTIVYYVLKTPTDTEITDTTLINQLEDIYNAQSVDNTTNITQTNADLPFILSASALMKGSV